MVLARNLPIYAYKVCKIFMQCEVTGGKFISNIETAGFDYFGIDELPCLAEEKNNDSRSWMGASAITKSVDFKAFAVNEKRYPCKNGINLDTQYGGILHL